MSDQPHTHRVLIRLPNWLGDAVMASGPVLRFMRERPDVSVTLMGNAIALSVFEGADVAYESILFDRKKSNGVSGLLASAKELRAGNFDEAYLLPNSFSSAFVAWWAGIPKRIGYAMHQRGMLLTKALPVPTEKPHQAVQYAQVFDRTWTESILPHIAIAEEESRTVQSRIGLSPQKRTLVMAPGAAYGTAKRWLPERYAELATRVVSELNADVVLVGSTAEAELAESITAKAGVGVRSLAGKTSLREMMALLAASDVVVCNDSGVMHVATGVQTPVVAIFGPTNWRETYPLGEQVTVIREPMDCAPCMKRECPLGHHNCMKAVDVERVFSRVAALLG